MNKKEINRGIEEDEEDDEADEDGGSQRALGASLLGVQEHAPRPSPVPARVTTKTLPGGAVAPGADIRGQPRHPKTEQRTRETSMNMANGTQTHDDKKLSWKPRKLSKEILPDAPEGEWEARIPKGKSKVTVTQKGDPRILISFKLEKAADEENEKFQGAEVTFSAIIFDEEDPDRRRASNMMKGRLRALCEWAGVELADVFPEECNSPEDFKALFDAVEGSTGTVWTVHSKRKAESGEEMTDTEVRFSKPGGGAQARREEESDDRGSKKKTAKKGRR